MTNQLSGITLGTVPAKMDSATESGKYRIISSYEGFDRGLTEAGLEFLNLCNGKRTLKEIANILRLQFKTDKDGDEEKAVIAFCHYLMEKNLVRVLS